MQHAKLAYFIKVSSVFEMQRFSHILLNTAFAISSGIYSSKE